ncbi:beta-1,4-galactosyltransferase 3-like [Corythoichthys intestinalis]|uniref:beta-1,4-galactosyltransferase 3-like n=1 Tax=Corythoichthys intestinalis TaxID=161448 RepID=UPI0025A54A80|nr:beta-1,4-galactosyltransferase 3-like [Corythoichthys intestinalis]XP_057705267.1 beta-1,4-galactosyltransferase 3-like [Corythoichthys intestinalis]
MVCSRRLRRLRRMLALLAGLTVATFALHSTLLAAPPPLSGCRVESPLLVGPRPVHLPTSPPTLAEIGRRSTLVSPGGFYRPPHCQSRHRTAIVIPYRARLTHLRYLLDHLHPFLQRQQIYYKIYVVEQWGDGTFNKGILFNAGIVEVLRDDDWSCIILHDVDLLAEDDRNTYACDNYNPMHLAVAIDKFDYRLPYREYFGGVVAMTPEQYRKINGFSNQYWGWGREDDDLWKRVGLSGMKVVRPSVRFARYKMIKHERDPGNEENPHNFDILKRTKLDWRSDGLNSLSYKLLSKEQKALFTHLTIDVGEKPRT